MASFVAKKLLLFPSRVVGPWYFGMNDVTSPTPWNYRFKIYSGFYSPTILILLCFWVRVGKADPWCSRHALIMEPYVDVIMDAAGSEVEFFQGNQKSSLNNG